MFVKTDQKGVSPFTTLDRYLKLWIPIAFLLPLGQRWQEVTFFEKLVQWRHNCSAGKLYYP